MVKAAYTPKEILKSTDGYALVPHGLGMTLPSDVTDIIPSDIGEGYVEVCFSNGSKMLTDTLEYVGVNYRSVDAIHEMSERIGLELIGTLKPVLFTKL